MRKINRIILHCSATKEGKNFQIEDVRNWHIWPKDYFEDGQYKYTKYKGKVYQNRKLLPEEVRGLHGNGWSDIGYHYVILLDGTVKEGKKEQQRGAHTKGYNKDSIGICYIGGLDENGNPKDTRTPEQKDSMIKLLVKLKQKYMDAELCGHYQFSSKACPSFKIEDL